MMRIPPEIETPVTMLATETRCGVDWGFVRRICIPVAMMLVSEHGGRNSHVCH